MRNKEGEPRFPLNPSLMNIIIGFKKFRRVSKGT
jgi:hypothetical protein